MFRVSDPLRGVLICENVEVVNVRGKGELEGLHAEKYWADAKSLRLEE